MLLPLALVSLSANETLTTGALTPIPWDTIDRDTAGLFSAGSPTVFTIPAGVSQVKVRASISWANNTTGERFLEIRKNGGTGATGLAASRILASSTSNMSVASATMDVNPTDTFENRCIQTSGGDLDVVDIGADEYVAP